MEVLYTVDNQLRKVNPTHLKVLFDLPGVEIGDIDIDMRKGKPAYHILSHIMI